MRHSDATRLGQPRLPLVFLAALWFVSPSFAQSEKVRVGMPSFSLSFMAPRVAQVKGHFRNEGLDVELIQMATNLTIVALTTKEIDYGTASGAILRAGVRGLPLKVAMFFVRRPLHVLVVKPEIRSPQELKGKIVGFAGYGDTTEVLLRAMLRHVQIDMDKEVVPFLVAGSGARLTALLTGKIDAAVLPPPFNFEAEAKGFRRLVAAADVVEANMSGLAIHNDRLQENPGQLKRMIRALLRTQTSIKENKTETVRIISDWLKLQPEVAAASYDLYVRGLSPDGTVSERTLLSDIERARQAVKMKEEVPLARVIDFGVLKEALSEMKTAPASR